MAGLIKPASTENTFVLEGTLCPLRSKTEIFPMPNQFGQVETLNASVVVPCDKRCMLYRQEADGTHHCGLKP